jgi:polyketide biosynthesis acyl carrier protein
MPKDKHDIFAVVRRHTLEILPDLQPGDVTIDKSLTELGANSVDRVEILMYAQEELGLKIPTAELQGLHNLQGLVDLLHRHVNTVA